MKIISKFRDYYDSVLVHGQDEITVFQRTSERIAVKDLKKELSFLIPEIRESRYPYPTLSHQGYSEPPETNYFFRPFVIAFCGKIYRGIAIDKYRNTKRVAKTSFVYSFDEYSAYCNANNVFNKRDPQFLPYMQVHRSPFREPPSASKLNDVKCWLQQQGSTKYFDQLLNEKIAIAVCHDGEIERQDLWPRYRDNDTYCVDINCSLKSFEFYKLCDAYTAFQELEMYLSGTMSVKEKEMITLDNKSLIKKHGFDKHSFKKR